MRRFLFDPGQTVLTDIEAVNILDLEPPEPIQGVGSGMALLVGEFEDGPFATPTQILSASSLRASFGEFGFVYGGTVGNNPCARSRKADSAVAAEYWNGNGFVYLSGKTFAQLVLCRVDTSVGSVQFNRLASVLGASKVAYSLVTGQHLDLDIGGGTVVTTFTGTAAAHTGSGAAFGSIAAGDTVTLGYDGAPNFVVTFLAGDTVITNVIARINQYAGFTFASNSAGQLTLTGRQGGTGGQVRVVAGSGSTVANLGLTVANYAGSGNVANIGAVQPSEINAAVVSAVVNAKVEQLADGTLRAAKTTAGGSITVVSTTTATDFGFASGAVGTAAVGSDDGTIPAGTRVSDGGSKHFVTMQTIAVTQSSSGPYNVKVRHATDDGTGLSVAGSGITTIESPIQLDAFSVTNPIGLTVALTEPQIDAQYDAAFDATKDLSTVGKLVNLSYAARQSNEVRRKGRQNALDASSGGCRGRIFTGRPPLGTTPTAALGAAEPGVQPYRDQRFIYCFPGVQTKVTRISQVGTAGGAGFTASGVIDVGSDGFLVSVMSQLPPEEDPGQQTDFLGAVLGLESSPNAQGFDINTYIAFKAGGICAPIIDGGQAGFQSAVTSVDPGLYPVLVDINRRRMADFIQDSIAEANKINVKKLSKVARRIAVKSNVRQFLVSLLGLSNPAQQRIAGFTVDDKSGNTGVTLAAGIYRLIVQVRTLTSMKYLVFETTIGSTVTVKELAPGEIQ